MSKFVENLKGELEATFKEDVSVYFDENPHDRLQETYNVDKSLEGKLKCLIFIPILSQTYCDPNSYAWQYEFLAFLQAVKGDRFGKDVRLRGGNVASRILPIRIHDLEPEDMKLFEKETGSVLRAMDFVFKTATGVNRPLLPEDSKNDNLNKTLYRDQINKVAGAIKEIILSMKKEPESIVQENIEKPAEDVYKSEGIEQGKTSRFTLKSRKLLLLVASLLLIIVGAIVVYSVINRRKNVNEMSNLDKSIAVLPFVNDSPDKENEYFCNGMMEEILNQLKNIGDLKVKARTSVERYRNPNKDIKVIGKELGVSLIMEGSVRKMGDDLRIAAQLIDAKTGDHLWSEIYDGKYTAELFEFQSNIAKKVAASLNAVITPQEAKKIEAKSTTDMQAYDLWVRGSEMVRKFRYTRDSTLLKLALNLFDQALKIDPIYTDALQGKGLTYNESGKYDSAIYYYRKIGEIDPDNFEYALGIGLVYMYSNNFDSAFIYYQKANELIPNNPWINLGLGQLLLFARNEVIKALPYYQMAYVLGGDLLAEINENVASPFFLMGDYTTALKYNHNALFLRSECSIIEQYVHCYLNQKEYNKAFELLDSIGRVTTCSQVCDIIRSRVYVYLKDYVKAEEFYKKAINSGYKQTKDDEIYLGCILIETGRKKEAISVLKKTIESDEDTSAMVPNRGFYEKLIKYRLVAAYAMIGDYKKALGYLSELEKLGFFEYPVVLNTFPGFDNLRSDPEFKAILNRIENEKASLRAQVKEMELRGEIDL